MTGVKCRLATQPPVEIDKTLKRLRKERDVIRQIDSFPNSASPAAKAAWAGFEEAMTAALSPAEPRAAVRAITLLHKDNYQERTWATRRHLWVDRVASAWLIRRFIDRNARFQWLDNPADCPKEALGFDFDSADFTHVDNKVTFEVLLASFGLDADPGLARLGGLIHALDVGGTVTAEAAGFEAILSGARERLDDDALLMDIGTVLDSMYTYFRKERTS